MLFFLTSFILLLLNPIICHETVPSSISHLTPHRSSNYPTITTKQRNPSSPHHHTPLLTPPDSVKVIGKQQWENLLSSDSKGSTKGVAYSCWNVALDRFRDLSIECDSSSENIKTLLGLTLTKCHFVNRGAHSGFPLKREECDLDEAFDLMKRIREKQLKDDQELEEEDLHVSELQTRIKSCLSHLSDSAFEIYIQFFNHLDNICFFLHSQVWQERTEDTVNRLAYISSEVVGKLNEVHQQHSVLLEQQRLALKHQENLLHGSKRIEQALDSGHSQLQSVFTDMRNEVQKEQKRLVSIFDDTFHLISRILQLQQNVVGRLTDFETVLFYIGLVITTFYLTAADSTRSVRATLYALWTLMLVVEFLVWRVSFYTELWGFHLGDANNIRMIMRRWRLCCVFLGGTRWVSSWWIYKDSTSVIVDALQDGLKELKEQLISTTTTTSISIDEVTADSIVTSQQNIHSSYINHPKARRLSCLYPLSTYHRDIFDNGEDEELLDSDYRPSSVPSEDDDEIKSVMSTDSSIIPGQDSNSNESLDRESLASGDWNVIERTVDGSQSDIEIFKDDTIDIDDHESVEFQGSRATLRTQNVRLGLMDRPRHSSMERRCYSTVPFVKGRAHHFRQARPIVNRAPIPGVTEDLKYLRLNPILLFETDEEFVENYESFIKRLKEERLRRGSSLSSSNSHELILRSGSGLQQNNPMDLSPHAVDQNNSSNQGCSFRSNGSYSPTLSKTNDSAQIEVLLNQVVDGCRSSVRGLWSPNPFDLSPSPNKDCSVGYDAPLCTLPEPRVHPKDLHFPSTPEISNFPTQTDEVGVPTVDSLYTQSLETTLATMSAVTQTAPFCSQHHVAAVRTSLAGIQISNEAECGLMSETVDMSGGMESTSEGVDIEEVYCDSDRNTLPKRPTHVSNNDAPPSIGPEGTEDQGENAPLRHRLRRRAASSAAAQKAETPKGGRRAAPKTAFDFENTPSDTLMRTPRRMLPRAKDGSALKSFGESSGAELVPKTSKARPPKTAKPKGKAKAKARGKTKATPTTVPSEGELDDCDSVALQKPPLPKRGRKREQLVKNESDAGESTESIAMPASAEQSRIPPRIKNASKSRKRAPTTSGDFSDHTASTEALLTPKPKRRREGTVNSPRKGL